MYYPRVDITHRMFNNKLKLTAHLSGYKQTYFAGSDDDNGFNKEVYRNAITYNPTTPVKDAEGNWSESPSKTDYLNPVGLIEEVEGENQATNLRMHASASFTPIDGLELKYLVSSNNYNQVRGYYETTDHISSYKTVEPVLLHEALNGKWMICLSLRLLIGKQLRIIHLIYWPVIAGCVQTGSSIGCRILISRQMIIHTMEWEQGKL